MSNIAKGSGAAGGARGRKRNRISSTTQSQGTFSQQVAARPGNINKGRLESGSTYRKISDLAQKLRLSTKVTERRASGKELLALLSDVKIKQKLLKEAGGNEKALSAVYQMLLRNSIYAAELVTISTQGKSRSTKVQAEDITLPYKLLRRVAGGDIGSATGASVAIAEVSPTPSSPGHAYHEDPGLFSPNEVLALLKFSLNMLNHEPAKAAAEAELLDMLVFICSKPEFVVCFHPETEMEEIMAEVQRYIMFPVEGTASTIHTLTNRRLELSLKAAQAFSNLISQASTRLAFQVHRFIPPCFEIVDKYVHHESSTGSVNPIASSSHQLLPYLYNVLVHLMAAHPEHCIPTLEVHGKRILSFARKCFPASQGLQREAIVDYISAHLLVCEVAGELQGLSMGELGQVGSASLGGDQLGNFLHLLTSDQQMKKLPMNVVAIHQARRRPVGRGRGALSTSPTSLSPSFQSLSCRHCRYLELCARLLKYCQINAVTKAKLKALSTARDEDLSTLFCPVPEDENILYPSRSLTSLCTTVELELSSAHVSDLTKDSPWGQTIGVYIVKEMKVGEGSSLNDVAIASLPSQEQSIEQRQTQAQGLQKSQSTQFMTQRTRAVDGHKSVIVSNTSETQRIVSCLQLVCACAEAFPEGECWSTKVARHSLRHRSRTELHFGDGKTDNMLDKNYNNKCRVEDVCGLICGITNLLVKHGSLGGDANIQVWGILALMKLTQSSFLALLSSCKRTQSYSTTENLVMSLQFAWQQVWQCLFRSDLRYSSFTADTNPNSGGELVLLLLTSILENKCLADLSNRTSVDNDVDWEVEESSERFFKPTTFLSKNSSQIWCLPCFRSAGSVKSQVVFDLIAAFERNLGIDDNKDSRLGHIDTEAMSAEPTLTSAEFVPLSQRGGIRYELCLFCLAAMETFLCNEDLESSTQIDKELFAQASICIANLANCSPSNSVVPSTLQYLSISRFSCTLDELSFQDHRHLCFMKFIDEGFTELAWKDFRRSTGNEVVFTDNDEYVWRTTKGMGPRLSPSYSSQLRLAIAQYFIDDSARNSRKIKGDSDLCRFVVACFGYVIQNLDAGDKSLSEADIDSNQDNFHLEDMLFPQVLALTALLCVYSGGHLNKNSGKMNAADLEYSVCCVLDNVTAHLGSQKLHPALPSIFACLSGMCCGLSSARIMNQWQMSSSIMRKFTTLASRLQDTLASLQTVDQWQDGEILSSDDEEYPHERKRANENRKRSDSFSSDDDFDIKPASIPPRNSKRQKKMGGDRPPLLESAKKYKHSLQLDSLHIKTSCLGILAALDMGPSFCEDIVDILIYGAESRKECLQGCLYVVQLMQEYMERMVPHEGAQSQELYDCMASACIQAIAHGRRSAPASSAYVLFGFKTIAEILAHPCFESSTASDLHSSCLEALHPSMAPSGTKRAKRALELRPRLRLNQLKAATFALLNAGESFHKSFDALFPAHFVLPSLVDLSYPVRLSAAEAVSATIEVLSNENVIATSVHNSMCPLSVAMEGQKNSKAYETWMEGIKDHSDESDLDYNRWLDAKMGFIVTTICTTGKILETVASEKIVRQQLYYLIQVSSDAPSLECLVYSVLENTAHVLGYKSIDALISEHEDWMLSKWMCDGQDLSSLPMAFCGASSFGTLLNLGLYSILKRGASTFGVDLDLSNIRGETLANYTFRKADRLVPVIFLSDSLDSNEDPNVASDESPGPKTKGNNRWKYLVETSYHLTGAEDDQSIARVVRKQVHNIYAYCVMLLQSNDESDGALRAKGDNALAYLKRIVSEDRVEQLVAKFSYKIVLYMLDLGGRKPYLYDKTTEFGLASEAAIGGIRLLTSSLNIQEEVASLDIFQKAGSSVIECILHCKMWLDRESGGPSSESRWNIISSIIDEILAKENISQDLAVCAILLNVMTLILMDKRHTYIHALVAESLRDVLERLSKAGLSPDNMSDVFEMVVAGIFQSRKDIFDALENKSHAREYKHSPIVKHRSLLSSHNGGSFSEISSDDEAGCLGSTLWQEFQYARRNDLDSVKTLEETKKILLLIFSDPESTDFVDGAYPFPFADDNELEKLLEKHEPHLSVQGLFKNLQCDFLGETGAFISFGERVSREGRGFYLFQDMQYPKLCALRRLLACLRRNQRFIANYIDRMPTLIRAILQFCGKGNDSSVQLAASECLGFLSGLPFQNAEEFMSSRKSGTVLPSICEHEYDEFDPASAIKIRALEQTGIFLFSRSSETALIAMETCRAVLSTSEGIGLWRSVSSRSLRAVLKLLTRSKLRSDPKKVPISLVNELRKDAQVEEPSTCQWCWEPAIWRCNDSTGMKRKGSFETMISRVVCSIIYCCSNGTEQPKTLLRRIDLESDIWLNFIAMASASSHFANTIFPGIVFDLVSHKDVDESDMPDEVIWKPNTEACSLLSKGFMQLLENDDVGSKAIATMTLMLLFRFTQEYFLNHEGHKRNLMSLPNRTYPDQVANGREGKSSKQRNESNYNDGLEPAPKWGGLPYGHVLDLNELDIASACLSAKQPASGLLFSDCFSDNYLGGAGGFFERRAHASTAIGGVIAEHDTRALTEDADIKIEDIRLLGSLSRSCFLSLGDSDATSGLDSQVRSISFNGTLPGHDLQNIDFARQSALETLTVLDNEAQKAKGRNRPPTVCPRIANQLVRLGLSHTMQQYVIGCSLSGRSGPETTLFDEKEKANLQNLWFREVWRQLQWGQQDTASTASVQQGDPQQISTWLLSDSGKRLGFHQCLNGTFLSLQSDDRKGAKDFIERARKVVLKNMGENIGGETPFLKLAPCISKFTLLNELASAVDAVEGGAEIEKATFLLPTEKRNEKLLIEISDLTDDWEMHFSSREILLRIFQKKQATLQLELDFNDVLKKHLKSFCNTAIKRGQIGAAEACISRWGDLVAKPQGDVCAFTGRDKVAWLELSFFEARVMHLRGEFSESIRTVKLVLGQLKVIKSQNQELDVERLIVDAMRTCGAWISKHRIESAKTILANYLKPASSLAAEVYSRSEVATDLNNAVDAHLSMAEFVSNIYEGVVSRVTSPEWKQAGEAARERRFELDKSREMYNEARERYQKAFNKKGSKGRKSDDEALAAHESTCHDLVIHIKVLEREVEMDRRERDAVGKSLKDFLELSLESYESGLGLSGTKLSRSSDAFIKHVFRLTSLWFSNQDNAKVNERFVSISEKVPSFQFVPLTYQIFSRLDKDTSIDSSVITFQIALKTLITKMCIQHPYHTLVQLIALSNGNKVGTGVGGRQSTAYLHNVGEAKVQASNELLEIINRTAPPYVSSLMEAYNTLIESYIELAMAPTELFQSQGKIRTKDIPMSMAYPGRGREKVASLERVLGSAKRKSFSVQPCVLTKPPYIRPLGDYGEGKSSPIGTELIEGFQSTFDLTETGLHRPKIVLCFGSKGTKFKQLVKGEDDIRQDAIMEQVFTTVNRMLRTKSNAFSNSTDIAKSSGDLKIATYNIVPLSPACGVLEWVDHTIPFGEYLVDKPRTKKGTGAVGAHSRYYPGEWSNNLCRTHMRNAPVSIKREAYDEVCKHFSPAFRFFFMEKFAYSSQAWHSAKMRYTRSCAVSSIVGHILGIGDRHCHNILIHEKTGEVVHIDFGIVFDQGKCLTTPETVPFRLTRDIVDGMGPSGTEGVFSSAAEATMSLMRDNAGTMMTVLSAVVSDPLYKWSVNPVKARMKQTEAASTEDDDDIQRSRKDSGANQTISTDAGDPCAASDAEKNDDKNEAANRAITKISEKLQGYEDGTSGECQSIEGQVQFLINSARDPDNLCSLYFGWAPWI